jgi:hypothetical protein
MKVNQMLNALPVLQKIMELKLPIKKAYKIYNLAKSIEDKRQFFIQEEKKLIDKFNAEILENGNIKFNSVEDQITFSQEHADLMNYEIEELETLELNFDDLGDAEFTPRDLMTLEGVINFVEY